MCYDDNILAHNPIHCQLESGDGKMEHSDMLESCVFDLLCNASEKLYLFLADLKRGCSRWSPAAVSYFGLPGEYIENTVQVWASYVHPDDRRILLEDIRKVLTGKSKRLDCEYRARNASGEYVWVNCKGTAESNPDGSPGLFVGMMTDLGGVSVFDPVSGLLSASEFQRTLHKELSLGRRGVLLLFGIDDFKRINDMYGFVFGDRLLCALGQQMQKLQGCTFYRMDGDKFACVASGDNGKEAAKIFSRVRDIAHALPLADRTAFGVSISCGAVLYPTCGEKVEALRAKAEYALEQAKRNGHDSMADYSEDLHRKSMNLFRLQEAIYRSINNDFEGFSLHYQPLICESDGTVFGAEALLRFSAPDLPQVTPADFIPVLEDSGSINEVGAWIIQTALRQAAEWRKLLPDFTISVNVSYLQMRRPGFRDMVLRELERSGVPADGLILELTESCRATAYDQLQADFQFFAEHQIKLALDDFGTGYASIAMLRELTPPWIKIDHTFVASIKDSSLDQAIIEYILQLCGQAGIQVCVEGIETSDIRRTVCRYHPELLQGYYFSKPMPASEFETCYIPRN